MPRSLLVDPASVRSPGTITIDDIPINAYRGDAKKEMKRYGAATMKRVLYDMLTIRGEKKSEREGKTEHHRWAERAYGSFSRSFTLPSNALADRVEASFRDGVLTLTIPKTEESKPRSVTIKP